MGIARLIFVAGAIFISTTAFAQVGQNDAIKDANLADIDSLRTALNADQALVDAIESGRPYTSALQLDAVLSQFMDEDQRRKAYGQVFRQINLNTSPREELMLIPGLSSRMAHEFEEYRPYTSLEQFRREIGKYVDEDEVARLEQYVFIPLGLNSASSSDLMTIPGMSSRMVHEFEEYRPFTSMEQFRREIGKYVDEDEVARLESYVILD
ncbi:MAG: helix-hairpin-helix domain-containing protein [Proteobacteria bacterium]|nr:helix-hairpin-helix domain-containing protein [Pseudomonadota bacterium]